MWSRGVAGILWEVFQQFSAVGQELASSAAFVPGLYLVAVGLKLLGYVMRTNASADVRHDPHCSPPLTTSYSCKAAIYCGCVWEVTCDFSCLNL